MKSQIPCSCSNSLNVYLAPMIYYRNFLSSQKTVVWNLCCKLLTVKLEQESVPQCKTHNTATINEILSSTNLSSLCTNSYDSWSSLESWSITKKIQIRKILHISATIPHPTMECNCFLLYSPIVNFESFFKFLHKWKKTQPTQTPPFLDSVVKYWRIEFSDALKEYASMNRHFTDCTLTRRTFTIFI